jgi:hypothetical protein
MIYRGIIYESGRSPGRFEQAASGGRRVVERREDPILDAADQHAVLGRGHALDLGPLLVLHKCRPGGGFGRLVGPFQQIDELGLIVRSRFPHRGDVKSIGLHDARGMVAKARMEGRLVVLENLVNSKLVDHCRDLGFDNRAAPYFSMQKRPRKWARRPLSHGSEVYRYCGGGIVSRLEMLEPRIS